jgi:hypothetical protein
MKAIPSGSISVTRHCPAHPICTREYTGAPGNTGKLIRLHIRYCIHIPPEHKDGLIEYKKNDKKPDHIQFCNSTFSKDGCTMQQSQTSTKMIEDEMDAFMKKKLREIIFFEEKSFEEKSFEEKIITNKKRKSKKNKKK